MMRERSVELDHSIIYRWSQKFTPQYSHSFGKARNGRLISVDE